MVRRWTKPLRTIFWAAPMTMLVTSCLAFAQAGPLSNTGFEDMHDSMPADWKVFVAPQPGATGELDSDHSFEGRNSIRLHIPTPYSVEPANNWSQPLPIESTGVRVRISAHIKTQDATEAAIWLQCFKRDPWMVLKQVTSSTDSPVYGTMNWTPVEFETLIPRGTDYAMIRCVLKGHGTAWFDNVTVDMANSSPKKSATPANAAPRETPIEATPPALESISPPKPKPIAAPPPQARLSQPAQVANDKLRESNDALADQLLQLQAEIAELRAVLTHPVSDRGPAPLAPPLVPHGYHWEDHQE